MSSEALPIRRRYALVIFDMDGTLTEELLDFAAIRREIGVPDGVGILEYISHLSGSRKSQAEEILHRHEIAAAGTCVLHEGALEILAALKGRGIRTALLTRNSSACAQSVLSRHRLSFDWVATRDHPPHKPHRDSILNITRHFAILPEQTLMVGDYLYDLQAARNAGVDAALVCHKTGPAPDFARMATYVVRSLGALLELATGTR
jgi:HAD superfamily hydrolase (TIGR01509 family)